MHSYIQSSKMILSKINQKGFFHLLSANMIIKVVGFGSQLFVAWWLTPEDMGTIKILQTYFGVFVILASAGFDISTLKLCSENIENGEKRYLFIQGLKYSLLSVLIIIVGINIGAYFELFSIDKKINYFMRIYTICCFPAVLGSIYLSYFQAMKKLKIFSYIQIITKLINILLIILMTYWLKIEGFILAIVLGYFISLIILFLYEKIKLKHTPKFVTKSFQKHFKYSGISLITNFIGILTLSIDLFIINYLIEERNIIGYYGFALVFIGFLRIFNSSIQQMANPYFSSIMDNVQEMMKVYKKYNKLQFKFTLFILIISLITVPIFMKFAINGKYEASIPFFVILVFSWFFRSQIYIQGSAFFGMGKVKVNLYLSLFSFGTTGLAVYFGIITHGIIGGAIGSVLASIFIFIISRYVFNRNFKFE